MNRHDITGSGSAQFSRTPLTQLGAEQVADVYKAGRHAATLTRLNGAVRFEYRQDYLATSGAAVAKTLPRTDQPVVTAAGAVPPFFAALLPEGRRLSSLRRAAKASADDELSLLLAVGADTVGDVQVVRAGSVPEAVEPLVEVEASFSELDFAKLLRSESTVDPVALAGVQDKASAGMISVPAKRRGLHYLLKIDPPEYPGVVLNEAFFIEVAAEAGLPVVRAEIVRDAVDRPGLLVERFDRRPGPDGSSTSLAVEDGTQVLGLYPADKYNVSAESVVMAMAELCPARAVATRALFTQLCFAWLTGNGDVHAKNVSIVETRTGDWRVAPAYDLPSTLPYGDYELALTMQGKSRGLSRKTLLAFGAEVGLRERAAGQALNDVLDATAGLETRLSEAGLPFTRATLNSVTRNLRNRRRAASET